MRHRGVESCAWFTPQEPDRSVRRWGPALVRSGRLRILDVGCGGGRHVIYLARLGLAVTAGDCSPLALRETQEWLAREALAADLLQLDMVALPFPSGAFDAVLSVNVLHHECLEEARAAVREVWRVLRPGGLFLAVLSGAGDCHCVLERTVSPARHLPGSRPGLSAGPRLYDERELHSLFAGFRIINSQRRSLSLAQPAGPPDGQRVNWRIWAERP